MAESTPLQLTVKGGSPVAVPPGTSAREALEAAGVSTQNVLAARLGAEAIDLARPIRSAGTLVPLGFSERAGRDILQHSAAHLVAKALTETIPGALPTVGPPTEEGFYYDFDVRALTPADAEEVGRKVARDVDRKLAFERVEFDLAEARQRFAANPHKLRYLDAIPPGEPVSAYRTGDFLDLCRGPHVPDTGWLAGLHVLGVSAVESPPGAGTSTLQRVRGVAFPTRAELDRFLSLRAEAATRDHRALGTKLDLFSFSEEIAGFPFWHPNGMVIVRELEGFVREHLRDSGYSEIRSPLLFPQSVYERSGHWEHYQENIFLLEVGGRSFGLKPMNCPGSMLIFGSRARSYRELPMRLAEFAPLHRLEASGTLHGLTRVREFVQDDAHLFVTESQIAGEIRVLLDWVRKSMETFQLRWRAELSTRPKQYLGEATTWDRAEAILEAALVDGGVDYEVSPGEGAFYGPKIDFHLKDSLDRSWQCGTIQLDFQMPGRFGLQYQSAEGKLETPVVIHRVILGSWERFIGILLEHTNGRLPPWLAPTQVRVLPVSERQSAAADGLVEELRAAGVRAERSGTDESLSKRIREAEVGRVPYTAVLGDREVDGGTVSIRLAHARAGLTLSRAEFLGRVAERVRTRSFEP